MAGYHVHWRFTQQDEVKNQQSSSEGNNKALYNFVAQFRQERKREREREEDIVCVYV